MRLVKIDKNIEGRTMKHFLGVYIRQQKRHILAYLLFCFIFP